MNILPIDFDLPDDKLSTWHDKWSTEKFGEGVLDPGRYYQASKDGLYLYADSVAEDEALNEEKAIRDHVLELLLRIRAINRKLKGVGIKKHLTYQERKELKKSREALYNEFKGFILSPKFQQEPQQIPPKLDTNEAKRYFDKAIELGLMDSNYKWLKGLQMLACFAYSMSIKLKLGKGENSDGRPRISWKPFETLFSVDRGKLRLNYNDIQKTGQQPKNSYLIDMVFE